MKVIMILPCKSLLHYWASYHTEAFHSKLNHKLLLIISLLLQYSYNSTLLLLYGTTTLFIIINHIVLRA